MENKRHDTRAAVETLCLACGMCCNGAIFADVKFQDKAKAERFSELGLKVSVPRKPSAKDDAPTLFRLPQPCPAFDGVRCRVYRERPDYCRQFECHLLRKVRSGSITTDLALWRIAAARTAVKRIDKLLSKFEIPGQVRPLPLARRFQRVLRRAEKDQLGPELSAELSLLTGQMHRLNLLLGRWFYPGG